ncbi:hypothetical protein ACV3QH_17460 [Clostridium perfringens]
MKKLKFKKLTALILGLFLTVFMVPINAYADSGTEMNATIEAYHGRGYVDGSLKYNLTPGNVSLVIHDTDKLINGKYVNIDGLKLKITLKDSSGRSWGTVTQVPDNNSVFRFKIKNAGKYSLRVEILNGSGKYKIRGVMHDHYY